MNKIISSLIVLVALVSAIWLYNSSNVNVVKPDSIDDTQLISQSNDGKMQPKESVLKRSIARLNVSEELKLLAEQLLPISPNEMSSVWNEEYGCYVLGAKQLAEVDALLSTECEHSLLTAHSYEEAMWMQRQGYPDKSSINLLDDESILSDMESLAKQNFIPALNLMSIAAFNKGNFEESASWALSANAYSNNQSTFAYRIRGEAQISNGIQELGLMELKVASYLGDIEAEYLFNRYAYNNPRVAIMAVEHANLYMSRTFGLPFGQYPSDPRPNDFGGG